MKKRKRLSSARLERSLAKLKRKLDSHWHLSMAHMPLMYRVTTAAIDKHLYGNQGGNMPRPRKSKAQKIREMLAKGKKPTAIAKALDCAPKYVYEVRWHDAHPDVRRASRAKRREYLSQYHRRKYRTDRAFRERYRRHARAYQARKRAAARLAA